MSGLVVLAAGLAAAALGTMLAAGAGGVSRLALARWISQRQHGSTLAAALLSAPFRVVGPAHALAAGGVVLAGLGLAAALGTTSPPVMLAALILGMPVLLTGAYAIPRATGHRWAEPMIRASAPWLERVTTLAGPLLPGAGGGPSAVPMRQGAQTVGEDEIVVLAGVLTFTERLVREVMTPRTDIVALQESATARDAAALFAESGYSRLPVYRDSLDHLTGMAYVFDLLKVEPRDRLPVRAVLAVPGTRRCADLLFDMQRERRQLAVVLDEFGGTAGMVTLEDLLEELVGEISDETDRAGPAPRPDLGVLEVDGTVPAQDVAARFAVTLPGGRETMSGVLATVLGRIPAAGERIVIGPLEFDVLRASPTRIERLLVRRAGSARVTVVEG